MEQVVSRLVEGLVKRGHTVAVQTLRTRPAPSTEVNGALMVRRAPATDLTPWLGLQQAVSLPLLIATGRLIRSFQPDVIHAHNLFFRTTEVAALLRMVYHVPLVTTVHLGKAEGSSDMFNALIKIYESTVGRFILHRSDRLIAVSHAVAAHLQNITNGGAPVSVIPNGVDTEVFFPRRNGRPAAPTILFVGRLVSNKGPEIIVRAAPQVLSRHPRAQFVLVGDGPLRKRLQRQTSALGIADRVRFLGNRLDVPQLMREAALFVRPSTLEGMPLTVLEAMASGLPVVATPVGGTPEILNDGVNGYSIPVGDSNSLARAIIGLLDNSSLAEEMGRRGREMAVAGHSWDYVVDRTERVYELISKVKD